MDDPVQIARVLAEEACAKNLVRNGLISISDHPWRAGLGRMMASDEQRMLRELYRALKPLANRYDFVDIHIWSEGAGVNGVIVSLSQEGLLKSEA